MSQIKNGQYAQMEEMIHLYGRLQDEQSKRIFWARLQYEAEPSMDSAIGLYKAERYGKESLNGRNHAKWREEFNATLAKGKKIVLYGASSVGLTCADLLRKSGIDIFAFCDRAKVGQVLQGKQVLSPKEIIQHPECYVVLITAYCYYDEILQYLLENKFPEDSIITDFEYVKNLHNPTLYREFPQFFKKGTAIVDAGCYDAEDTVLFSRWSQGAYSKIYAFEPDPVCFSRCEERIASEQISNASLLPFGLSNVSGTLRFAAGGTGIGHLVKDDDIQKSYQAPETGEIEIKTAILDDLIREQVGMIKMDIEGAEFDALHGAESIIRRDKPHLAICVYHRVGDMLAIMSYLHELVPEYRFWLRHYGPLQFDTILYAAV